MAKNKFYNEAAGAVYTVHDPELLVNPETGEVEPYQKVDVSPRGPHFWRLYMREFLSALGKLEVTENTLDILCFMLENINADKNTCYLTQVEIAAGVACSRATVGRCLSSLEEAGFIHKQRNGRYMFDPKIMMFDMNPGYTRYNMLIRVYNEGSSEPDTSKKKHYTNKNIKEHVQKKQAKKTAKGAEK